VYFSAILDSSTDVAQDGVFPEIALRTLWSPHLHFDSSIAHISVRSLF
jgi:hypothetical protein